MEISQVSSNYSSGVPKNDVGRSMEAVKPTAEPVQVSPQAVQASSAAPKLEEVKSAVEKINKAVQSFDRNLQFSVDSDTKMNIVKVIDTQTKDVIRQFPSEEALKIAQALDKLQGLLVRDKA